MAFKGLQTFEEKASAQPTPPPDTLTLSRAEAKAFHEALRHLPCFLDDAEQCALMDKLQAFLYPKEEA